MKLTGVYAPFVTPFDADENINYPVLQQLLDFLLANGLTGLVPGGTTGEVYAFSDAERLELFQFTKEYVDNRAVLAAGVNAGATRDVIRFSQAGNPVVRQPIGFTISGAKFQERFSVLSSAAGRSVSP